MPSCSGSSPPNAPAEGHSPAGTAPAQALVFDVRSECGNGIDTGSVPGQDCTEARGTTFRNPRRGHPAADYPAGLAGGPATRIGSGIDEQHGVSRTVLRQAIRLLEHHAVAHMQRGATGGLVVGRPDLAATVRAVGIYLEYEGIAPRDILETRLILEQATIALAVERLDAEGEARLRADIAAESVLDGTASADALQRLHFTLADLSGDPALRLFAGIVLQISDAHSNFSRRSGDDRDKVVRRIRKLHRDIAESVIARNAAAACMLMERYLVGYRDWME
jgi:DNA-binding FadR family transcriptional regulator